MRHVVGSLLLLASCGSNVAPQKVSRALASSVVDAGMRTDLGSITGRVLLDGKPVPYFGVIVSRNFASLHCCEKKQTPFHTRNKQFTIKSIESKT